MDIYQMLMQDHWLIQEIFSEIGQTKDTEVERRELLFKRLRNSLEDHAVIEENIFHPEIEKFSETQELVGDAFDNNAELDAILAEIAEMRTNKSDWLERSRELKNLVEEHMRKEDKIFQ